ncbi:MAG: esterase [Rhodothermales bacterium]|jgi:esterase
MKLHRRESGSGAPLVIVHGLFGSSRNWMSITPKLAEQRRVIAVDLRNHGDSPHDAHMSLADLADDLADLLDEPADFLGHSLGGKAAMILALKQPEKVRRLIVVDIAPASYPAVHTRTIAAMQSVPLCEIRARADADAFLARTIEDSRVRRFLLTNLNRVDGKFQWRLNLDALATWIRELSSFTGTGTFDGPSLFLAGERSDYVGTAEADLIACQFPNSALQFITDAGHWIHADQPAAMIEAVEAFLP